MKNGNAFKTTCDPREVMRKALGAVSTASLRTFLVDFFQQDGIESILCRNRVGADSPMPRYTVQILRGAAEVAKQGCGMNQIERDAKFVAIFVEGCRLDALSIADCAITVDVEFSEILLHCLRGLGHRDERMASLLRMCLGRGLQEEEDSDYAKNLRQGVRLALKCPQEISSHL
jgi:hypothetical protein